MTLTDKTPIHRIGTLYIASSTHPPQAVSDRVTAIIVDDVRLERDELRYMLEARGDVDVVGEAENVAAALAVVDRLRPDAVFLDIELRGETGFDLLTSLPADQKVIFVTGHDEYVSLARASRAFDLLLKPVNPSRLDAAVKRLRDIANTALS